MIELIVEYKRKFPEIFEIVAKYYHTKEPINVGEIYYGEDDPNIKLMNVYFYLLLQP